MLPYHSLLTGGCRQIAQTVMDFFVCLSFPFLPPPEPAVNGINQISIKVQYPGGKCFLFTKEEISYTRQLVGLYPTVQYDVFRMLMTALLCSCGSQGVLRAEGWGDVFVFTRRSRGARGSQGVPGVRGPYCDRGRYLAKIITRTSCVLSPL